jgi:hypothetical protein
MSGPIEDKQLPTRLMSHVVTSGAAPRIHGYDVQSDLARHYEFTDVLFLALVGELPQRAERCAFDVALAFAAPVTMAEAPAHAAALSRVCGPRTSSMFAVAAIAAAEQVRVSLDAHADWLSKLVLGELDGSEGLGARDDDDRDAVRRLELALGTFAAKVPALRCDVGLETAIISTLVACGFRAREQLEAVLSLAKLPTICAEALAWRPGELRAYPMNLPRFEYVDG